MSELPRHFPVESQQPRQSKREQGVFDKTGKFWILKLSTKIYSNEKISTD